MEQRKPLVRVDMLSNKQKITKKKQIAAIQKSASKADFIITTALIPGKKAPILITEDMVKDMKIGSVIVDLAAVNGGNCQYTEAGKTISIHGITIIGVTNLPSTMPTDASKMFGKNVINFIKNMIYRMIHVLPNLI